jgi:hypothetical protein
MDEDKRKLPGYISLVVCGLLLTVAWERYADNAQRVEQASRMLESSPLGGVMGGMMQQMTGKTKMEAGVPAATTFSLIFAFVSGALGVGLLATSAGKPNVDHPG